MVVIILVNSYLVKRFLLAFVLTLGSFGEGRQ